MKTLKDMVSQLVEGPFPGALDLEKPRNLVIEHWLTTAQIFRFKVLAIEVRDGELVFITDGHGEEVGRREQERGSQAPAGKQNQNCKV